MKLLVDTREPWPHPWAPMLHDASWGGWEMERSGLETGDLVLEAMPNGVVIERKTPGDMAACMSSERERFERELKRGRYTGRFIVVVEGDLTDVFRAAQGMHRNAVIGTLATWTARYCPFVFAGSQSNAADFAFRALASQIRAIERLAKMLRA